jgi:hypothetical protein
MGMSAGALSISPQECVGKSLLVADAQSESPSLPGESGSTDYSIHIRTSAVEIAPKRIISATTYNGQFPGPLLRPVVLFHSQDPVFENVHVPAISDTESNSVFRFAHDGAAQRNAKLTIGDL